VRIERWTGQAGTDKKSVQWVEEWLRSPPQPFTSEAMPSVGCTTGTKGWDYECSYRSPSDGTWFHFGCYVLRVPTGEDVVQKSGVAMIGQPIPPRPR
jgi:hypothetical protein